MMHPIIVGLPSATLPFPMQFVDYANQELHNYYLEAHGVTLPVLRYGFFP